MVRTATSSIALVLALNMGGCAGGASRNAGNPSGEEGARTQGTTAGSDPEEESPSVSTSDPGGDIPFYRDGAQVGMVVRVGAERRDLTVVSLGDDWTPAVFTESPELGRTGRQPYRAQLIRLSNEATRSAQRHPTRRYLELYGIFPSLHVLSQRLNDTERHACHEAIDDGPIEAMTSSPRPGARLSRQRRDVRRARYLRNRLERAMRRAGVDSLAALASENARYARQVRQLEEAESQFAAIRAVQAHLRCEDFLPSRAEDGVLDWWTGNGLRAWQQRHMIISLGGRLDEVTRRSFALGSRELDFLSLLRALRERVVSATGLLEDGTAAAEWGEIVGRRVELDDEFRWAERLGPMENGAPDLVSAATDAAARALGWTDPEAAARWLNDHASERTAERPVALPLPELPAYHSSHMDLRAEIDRGDVWYGFPYTRDGRRRGMPVRRRPTTTIYVRHEGRDIPLVRWNTTIGSWQEENHPEGGVGMRYKNSDVGARLWRDVVASPAWLPPPSTPDTDLLRRRGERYTLYDSITGPGYNSAYGLAMVIHHLPPRDAESEDYSELRENGIRSHGSVSYRSILRGYSHGCHRLFNHLAVRMTSFLITHRNHEVQGRVPANWSRTIHPEGQDDVFRIEVEDRGYFFQLTPPVPVEVLRGHVMGSVRRPLAGFHPLPEQLRAEAEAAAAAEAADNSNPQAETPSAAPGPTASLGGG